MLMCFQFYGVFWGVFLAEEDEDGGCVRSWEQVSGGGMDGLRGKKV